MAPPSDMTMELAVEVRRRRKAGETLRAIARDFQARGFRWVSPSGLANYLAHHAPELDRIEAGRALALPPPQRKAWDAPLRLAGSWLILSDLQIPAQDPAFFGRCLDTAHAWGVPNLLVNGDYVNHDGASVKFDPAPEDSSLDDEWEVARAVARQLEARFAGRLVFTPGNHEDRLPRMLKMRMTFEATARLLLNDHERWTLSGYPYSLVGDWLVAHPSGASVIPGRYAQRLAAVYQTHVVAAHGHLQGVTRSESGTHWCIDSGMVADPARLGYAARHIKARSRMAQGAVILAWRDGRHYHYCLTPDVDWPALAALYRPGDLE